MALDCQNQKKQHSLFFFFRWRQKGTRRRAKTRSKSQRTVPFFKRKRSEEKRGKGKKKGGGGSRTRKRVRDGVMDALPDELVLHILSMASIGSVGRVMCTARRYAYLGRDDVIWKRHYFERCQPCPPDRSCLWRMGQSFDPTVCVYNGDHSGEWNSDWGRLLTRTPARHPMRVSLLYGRQDRKKEMADFTEGPWHHCPHHCASIVAHMGYRWAFASDLTPPRPIDASGLRVGRCAYLTRALSYKGDRAGEAAPVYRGYMLADRDVPHGVGMHIVRYTNTHGCGYDSGRPFAYYTVGMWHDGQRHGFVRRWKSDPCPLESPMHVPVFVEGTFRHDVADGAHTRVTHTGTGSIIENVVSHDDGAGSIAGINTYQQRTRRLNDGRLFTVHWNATTHSFAGHVYDVNGRLIYEGEMGMLFYASRHGVLYDPATGDKVYEGEFDCDNPGNKGTFFLTQRSPVPTVMLWPPAKGDPLKGAIHVVRAMGDTFVVERCVPKERVVKTPPFIRSFRPGLAPTDFASIPLGRITEWDVLYDYGMQETFDAEIKRTSAGFVRLSGVERHIGEYCRCAAFIAWPRLHSRLCAASSPIDGASNLAGTHCAIERVTREHVHAFLAVMARRHPQWARCVDALYVLFAQNQ